MLEIFIWNKSNMEGMWIYEWILMGLLCKYRVVFDIFYLCFGNCLRFIDM